MKRACVVGWPVAHSRSPLIHGYWLKHFGLDGAYTREAVAPESFAAFLTSLESRGYVGCNVTLPHKEAAFALVREKDPAALALGALNTVWLEGGVIHGANTDVSGFLANLDAGVPGWQGEVGHAVVLGAGGAARGIVYGLLSRGVERVVVVNRSVEKAASVSASFGPRVIAASWSEAERFAAETDLLVNSTSLGMTGQPPLSLNLSRLRESCIVTDAVYVPLETGLLVEAASRGHRTVGGLGMLLHQAVPGFERWFGARPAVTDELVALISADVRGG